MKYRYLFKNHKSKVFLLTFTFLLIGAAWLSSAGLFAQPADEPTSEQGGETESKTDNPMFTENDFTPLDATTEQEQRIYEEMVLEDFESNSYAKKQMLFPSASHKKADIAVRDVYPAPIKESKKYLGIKVYGKKQDALTISPSQPIIINKYVKNISIWVYGKGNSGSLFILVKDMDYNTHRLSFGHINYRGWQKVTKSVPAKISQKDIYLNQKSAIEIVGLVFVPSFAGPQDRWHYIYLDDLTATVREKYTDRQPDDW